jgi:hypothetical protein
LIGVLQQFGLQNDLIIDDCDKLVDYFLGAHGRKKEKRRHESGQKNHPPANTDLQGR